LQVFLKELTIRGKCGYLAFKKGAMVQQVFPGNGKAKKMNFEK
jgi:hypothetical protein